MVCVDLAGIVAEQPHPAGVRRLPPDLGQFPFLTELSKICDSAGTAGGIGEVTPRRADAW